MAFDPSAPYSSTMDDVPLKLLFGVSKLKRKQQASKEMKTIQSDSPPPKRPSRSSNAVRSKLRESLASDLATVGKEQHKECVETPKQLDTLGTDSKAPQIELKGATAEDCNGGLSKTLKRKRQKFKKKPDLVDDLASPFEGRLTWDLQQEPNDIQMEHGSSILSSDIAEQSPSKRAKLEDEHISVDINEQVVQGSDQPHTGTHKIEAELFKIHGAVDEKDTEKSRSLVVNLEEQIDPQLRAHVLSGEITPENPCLMTEDQLASKELSRWKISKSEEFSDMVVLPDPDASLRNLVNKLHKGKFHVAVQKDDTALEINSDGEILISTSQVKQQHAETNEVTNIIPETSSNKSSDKSEIATDCYVLSATSSNKVSGVIETKGGADEVANVESLDNTESLPVIISLNEYISSREAQLNDGVEADTIHKKRSVQGEDSELFKLHSQGGNSIFSEEPSMLHVDSVTVEKINADFELIQNLNGKLADSNVVNELQVGKAIELSPDEKLWDGSLQLTASITVTALAFFKSGEKAPTNNWSKFVEVKGRVRLDAFEKFLQELPLSRNRALMVVSIQWKVGSPETGLLGMQEVANSYKQGERVGFAELAPGVDLYVCPPDLTMINMLVKYGFYKNIESIKDKQDDLVGCVVWRRNHATSNVTHKTPEQHINAKKLALLGKLLDSPSHPGISQWTSYGTDDAKARISPCLESNSINVDSQGHDTDKSKLPTGQPTGQSVSFVVNAIAEEKENSAKNATCNMANVHGQIPPISDAVDLMAGFNSQPTSSVPNDPRISVPKALKQCSMPMKIQNDLSEEVPPGFALKTSPTLDGRHSQHEPTDEDDDDDDLPEFDFRAVSVTSQIPIRQSTQESNNAESLQLHQIAAYPSTAQQSIMDSNPGYFQPHISVISSQSHQKIQQVPRPLRTSHPCQQISDLIQKFGHCGTMVPFSSGATCRPNAVGANIADHLGQQPGVSSLSHVSPKVESPCSPPNACRKSLWDDDNDIPEWCPPYLEPQDCPGPSVSPAPPPHSGMPKFAGNLQPVHPPPPQGSLFSPALPALKAPQPLQVTHLPSGPSPPLLRCARPLNDMVRPIPRPVMERVQGNTSNPRSSFNVRRNSQSHLSRPEFRPIGSVDWRGRRF